MITYDVSRTEKNSAARKVKKAQAVVNREKGRERERDNKILFNNL